MWHRYAMREALAITTRQGMEKLWSEHRACHKQLWAGLSELGEASVLVQRSSMPRLHNTQLT